MTNCVKALSDPVEWLGVCTDTSRASVMVRASITVDAAPLSGHDILEIWPPSSTRDVSGVFFSRNAAHFDEVEASFLFIT